jgi:hypothetical protein
VVVAVALAAVVAGCSGRVDPQAEAAGAAARAFTLAARGDPSTACGLLAPSTATEVEQTAGSCAGGLADAELPEGGGLREVQVYGLDAMVRLEQDTVFLARFDDGWRITAAGCTPRGDGPYECDIKGG